MTVLAQPKLQPSQILAVLNFTMGSIAKVLIYHDSPHWVSDDSFNFLKKCSLRVVKQ